MKLKLTFLVLALAIAAPIFAQAGAHSNTLTWAWSQGAGDPATGFHVQRAAVKGGPYVIVGTVPLGTLTFTDTAVVGGNSFFYVVTAYNSGGDSTPSNEVLCTTPFLAPAPPTNLSGSSQ